jgi:hypothetical protein
MSDIIGRLLDEAEKAQRKGHLVLAEVCRDASDQLGLVTNERDGANALIGRMHAQDALAIQAWKKANPGHGLRWPGRISLSAWCLGEIANLEAERDRLREALRTIAARGCETFHINPIGGDNICIEGGDRFAHERDVVAVFDMVRAALKETGRD